MYKRQVGLALVGLKPFVETTTYRNVLATDTAVVNLVDDVRIFAEAAVSSPQYSTIPAVAIRGVVLTDCCSWREVKVSSIAGTGPRSRLDMTIVHRGVHREFIGFNRAKHAVLEAAILATRVHLLPPQDLERQFAELAVVVDKTAGPVERQAFALLEDYIGEALGRPEACSVSTGSRLHFGLLAHGGESVRQFGGAGMMIDFPGVNLKAVRDDADSCLLYTSPSPRD